VIARFIDCVLRRVMNWAVPPWAVRADQYRLPAGHQGHPDIKFDIPAEVELPTLHEVRRFRGRG
jgi:hypothetical protein